MALAGKLIIGTLGVAYATLYTAPVGTFIKAQVSVSNSDTTQRTFGLKVVKSGGTTSAILQPSTTPLPVGSSLDKTVLLESGDYIQGIGEVATLLDYSISATELT